MTRGAKTVTLEVKAFYTLAELARAGNVTKYRLRRVLRASGVALLPGGGKILVPLALIRARIPTLWESIALAEQLRSAGARGPRSVKDRQGS